MNDWKKRGWVRLYRSIEDNSLYFLEPFTKAQAWIDLFLNANHAKGFISIRGNIINIERGQIGWSELTMSKRWKWSKNKVRRFLKLLETEQQIEQQKDRYLTTIITILNYEKFQNDTADDTAERQQKDSRRYINKNDKNEKNEKKPPSASPRFVIPKIEECIVVFDEKGFNEAEAQKFWNFYESKGWMVGKNKMKSWRAAVGGWCSGKEPKIKKADKTTRYL